MPKLKKEIILPPAKDECLKRFGEMAANKAGHVALSPKTIEENR